MNIDSFIHLRHNFCSTINLPVASTSPRGKTRICRKSAMCSILLILLLVNITLSGTTKSHSKRQNDNRHLIGNFENSTCPFDIPEGLTEGKDIIFGYVTVPERHNRKDGRTIRLAVAVFPSFAEAPSKAPLVLCSTGPGTSAMEDFVPNFAGGNNPILSHCDAVVIELRGLHYSEPNLLCQERCDMMMSTLNKDLSAEQMMSQLVESIRLSHNRFKSDGVDVAAYNNVETASDIAMVMDALGYKKFNLFGNSAGTIIAQHVMRDYPERLRCVILSSPVPLGASAFESMVLNAIETLRRVFALYTSDEQFNATHPNLEAKFLRLLDKLNENPAKVPIQEQATGKTFKLMLNGNRLAQWLFMRMFWDSRFPDDLVRIIDADYTPLQQSSWAFLPMETFSYGLGNSIVLSEANESRPRKTVIPESYSVFASAVSAAGFGQEYIRRARQVWNVPILEPSAREMVKSDVPTLILCGQFDHVCPPRYGQILAKNLKNSYVYTFPGVAHSPIDSGPCAMSLTFAFLKDPTTAPDSSCIERY